MKVPPWLTWLGHAGFLLERKPCVYIDPWQLNGSFPPADLILITHAHEGHLSPLDIERVRRPDTVIAGPANCLPGLSGDRRALAAGETLSLPGLSVKAVPAYAEGSGRHPKGEGLGFLVEFADASVFHAGDAGLVPETKGLRADLALLPVAGDGMSAQTAAAWAREARPGLAVPMHYGTLVGRPSDAGLFERLCAEAGVEGKMIPISYRHD